jgi:hypothetical protein
MMLHETIANMTPGSPRLVSELGEIRKLGYHYLLLDETGQTYNV